jgi:hypothetical protein
MASFDDLGSEQEEFNRDLALRARKPEGPTETGYCHFCDATVPKGHRWCDTQCRDDWERASK